MDFTGGSLFHPTHNSQCPPQIFNMPHSSWGQELTPSPLSPSSMPLPPDGDLFTDSSRAPQPHFQQVCWLAVIFVLIETF
jgi:hypothetical protein